MTFSPLDPANMSRPDMIESLQYMAGILAHGSPSPKIAKAFAATLAAHADTLGADAGRVAGGGDDGDTITVRHIVTTRRLDDGKHWVARAEWLDVEAYGENEDEARQALRNIVAILFQPATTALAEPRG